MSPLISSSRDFCGRNCTAGARLDSRFTTAAGVESHDSTRGNRYFLARLRIATKAFWFVSHAEYAESWATKCSASCARLTFACADDGTNRPVRMQNASARPACTSTCRSAQGLPIQRSKGSSRAAWATATLIGLPSESPSASMQPLRRPAPHALAFLPQRKGTATSPASRLETWKLSTSARRVASFTPGTTR